MPADMDVLQKVPLIGGVETEEMDTAKEGDKPSFEPISAAEMSGKKVEFRKVRPRRASAPCLRRAPPDARPS